MISDVLSEATRELDCYLEDDFYSGVMRSRIVAVRLAMDSLRRELDTIEPDALASVAGSLADFPEAYNLPAPVAQAATLLVAFGEAPARRG